MNNSLICNKSKDFAIRIVNLYKYLCEEKHEYVLSKQLLRAGTSVGANVREARNAQSRADFVSKNNIALKEADEACYWLELLQATDYLSQKEYESIYKDADEIVKILVTIVKNTKQ